MATRPDLVIASERQSAVRARQPFQALRAAVAEASCSKLGLDADDERLSHLRMTEPDRPRLARGFDFSVPCIAMGRAIDRRPDEVASELAVVLNGHPSVDLIEGAESDGPYLNLRIRRRRFALDVINAGQAGALALCSHGQRSRTRFCLIPADDSAPMGLLSVLTSMAANCSGEPVDPLDEIPGRADHMVDQLVRAGIAERDPSGLTDAVFMGRPGYRFLLMSVGGHPTQPTRIASRLEGSSGRPVLLSVGAANMELVRRIEDVAGAAGMGSTELRVIEVRDRWLSLLDEIEHGFVRELSAVKPTPHESGQLHLYDNDRVFAVFRHLARLFEVNHRVLESTDPEHLHRFGVELRRRLRSVEEDAPEGGSIAVDTARAAFENLVGGSSGA